MVAILSGLFAAPPMALIRFLNRGYVVRPIKTKVQEQADEMMAEHMLEEEEREDALAASANPVLGELRQQSSKAR